MGLVVWGFTHCVIAFYHCFRNNALWFLSKKHMFSFGPMSLQYVFAFVFVKKTMLSFKPILFFTLCSLSVFTTYYIYIMYKCFFLEALSYSGSICRPDCWLWFARCWACSCLSRQADSGGRAMKLGWS